MKSRTLFTLLLCAFIGCSAAVLMGQSFGQRVFVSPRVLDDYRVNIEAEYQDIDNLEKLIEEKKIELGELEALEASNEDVGREVEARLFQDLRFYGLAGGYVDAEGPGVEIIINDSTREIGFWDDPNDLLVHDLDLLLVINDLKVAGAEMISVNGQRIVDTSAVTCSGYTVRINGQFYATPFVIRAIGDGSRMSAALIGPGGYGAWLRDEWGLVFRVEVRDDIKIPAYTEDRSFGYMTLSTANRVKEGESN